MQDKSKTKGQPINELQKIQKQADALKNYKTKQRQADRILMNNQEMRRKNEFILNVLKEIMALIDRGYVYEFANEAYCKAHGKTRSDIIGKTVENIWGQENFNNVIKGSLDKCFSGNEVHYEAWFGFKDKQRCYNVSCYPYFMNKGEVTHAVEITYDVTERKKMEKELNEERQRFQSLSENAPFGMVLIDEKGGVKYINQKFRELFGYDLEDIPDVKTWFRRAYPKAAIRHDAISTWVDDLKIAKPGEKRPRASKVTCKDGKEKTINFIPVQLGTGEHLIACEDITELKRSEEKIAFLATHDALTGLPNRRSLEEILKRSVSRAKRGNASTLLFMDIDDFKMINVNLGPSAGDKVLRTITKVLRKELRTEDIISRLAGDEFAVLLDGIGVSEALPIAVRIRNVVDNFRFVFKGQSYHLSLSIGLVQVDGKMDVVTLFLKADTAMWKAKEQGRNLVVLYKP